MLMDGDRYTPANRAGCALISLAFVYSTVFSAIFENSIPYVASSAPNRNKRLLTAATRAGNDIAALLPKYITVKRGFFICAGK
jgi:NCS1 family nucleobase:cation symporter-1